jgi:4-amino-4-deoxy-L-arabinose transferase-like glycosyltransferase
VALALPSVLGLRSVLAHQLWSCVMGVGTVVVIGLVGRRLAGPRAGLVAAALAAVYPNVWLWDGMVLSETLGMLTTAVVVLAAYRLWDQGSTGAAAALGVACGLGALTRAESALFLPAIMLPFVLWAGHRGRRRRLELAAVAGVVAAVVVAPWVVFNFTRFNHPPLGTSTNFPQTLLLANCDPVYAGRLLGSRSYDCFPGGPALPGDESDAAGGYRWSWPPGSGGPGASTGRSNNCASTPSSSVGSWGWHRPGSRCSASSRRPRSSAPASFAGGVSRSPPSSRWWRW